MLLDDVTSMTSLQEDFGWQNTSHDRTHSRPLPVRSAHDCKVGVQLVRVMISTADNVMRGGS